MHYAAVLFLKMIMKSKQLLLVLVAGTMLSLVANPPTTVAQTTGFSSMFQSEKQALAQAATNQFQTTAAAGTNRALAALGMTNQVVASATNQSQTMAAATNQFQAMAAAATNKGLAALGMTNQALASGTNQVQALLEKAKTLTANQKYQDALGYVTQLYNTKLTPDQKQQVDALKAQIQTAMAQKAESQATSVLGGFLGGKK
jgi:hypothetical protein